MIPRLSGSRSPSPQVNAAKKLAAARRLVSPSAANSRPSRQRSKPGTSVDNHLSVEAARDRGKGGGSDAGSASSVENAKGGGASDVIKAKFRLLDWDCDGFIRRWELGFVLKALDPGQWSEPRLDELLGAADQNGDGVIHFEEFQDWALVANENDDAPFAFDALPTPETQGAALTVAGRIAKSEEAVAGRQAVADGVLNAFRPLEDRGFRTITPMVAREATEILPWLYLGGKPAASTVLAGERADLGITDVFSCVYDPEDRPSSEALEAAGVVAYDGFWEPDNDEVDILGKHYQTCRAFVAESRRRGGRALVHCNWGKNRSALIAAALLVDILGMQAAEAVELLCQRRGLVLLGNENFCLQLALRRATGLRQSPGTGRCNLASEGSCGGSWWPWRQ